MHGVVQSQCTLHIPHYKRFWPSHIIFGSRGKAPAVVRVGHRLATVTLFALSVFDPTRPLFPANPVFNKAFSFSQVPRASTHMLLSRPLQNSHLEKQVPKAELVNCCLWNVLSFTFLKFVLIFFIQFEIDVSIPRLVVLDGAHQDNLISRHTTPNVLSST